MIYGWMELLPQYYVFLRQRVRHKLKYSRAVSRSMSLDGRDDELAYLWTKVKFIQKYMAANSCSFEAAEREFHAWIGGLMESRIERANRMLNEPSNNS